MPPQTNDRPKLGLVLPGGGARGAYQAGVLSGVAEMWPGNRRCPFPVITGTSVGAINAAVLASNAQRFHAGIADLVEVWRDFTCDKVYRSDARWVMRTGLHWLAALTFGGLGARNPRFLLDNAPLRDLLRVNLRFSEIRSAIDAGCLEALAVTCSGYAVARAVAFFEGRDELAPWMRARREGRRAMLGLDHLMASVAVPFIFPQVAIDGEYFGDGAIRESTPLSPAVHLGADRLLIIGVRDETPDQPAVPGTLEPEPGFGQMAGYMLDTLFLDGLYADLERLTRINRLVGQASSAALSTRDGGTLRCIDTGIIVPSKDIREIAQRHAGEFPRSLRLLLKGVGALSAGGQQLISYLLFEKGYCQELIQLGYRDSLAQRDWLLPFLLGETAPSLIAPPYLVRQLAPELQDDRRSGEKNCSQPEE